MINNKYGIPLIGTRLVDNSPFQIGDMKFPQEDEIKLDPHTIHPPKPVPTVVCKPSPCIKLKRMRKTSESQHQKKSSMYFGRGFNFRSMSPLQTQTD